MSIFINSIAHISCQQPCSEEWFTEPLIYNSRYVSSIEPDYNNFIAPMTARRMGKILKRALATALTVLRKTEIEKPDAIITGTGLGCIEFTEKFLTSMLKNNEELLSPSFFMQSTHNTIGSQIAVHLNCNGYNSTYSHRGTSFDSALADAAMQFELGDISNALVSGHDELTPEYFKLLDKIGYWKEGEITEEILRKSHTNGAFAGECSISFMLENIKKPITICELKAIELLYNPSHAKINSAIKTILEKHNLKIEDIDAVVAGISGDKENDRIYIDFRSNFFPNTPMIWYKHIFGESYSASGLGVYVAATVLQKGEIPKHLFHTAYTVVEKPKNILIYNHFQNKDHSLIYVSAC